MTYAYGLTTECTEMDGSPVEQSAEDSFRATVTLRCAWDDRYNLAAELVDTIYARLPVIGARQKSISIVPFTHVDGATEVLSASYECAVVTVEYVRDKDTPDEDGGELFSESLEPSTENLPITWEKFKWKNGPPISAGEVPGMPFPSMDYMLTKYNLNSIPAAALTLVGCCNDTAVLAKTLGQTFPTQTLLFHPPTLQRKVSIGSESSLKWTANYRFTFKPQGWNKFWNVSKAGGPGWDTLQVWNGSAFVDYDQYPPASFSGL